MISENSAAIGAAAALLSLDGADSAELWAPREKRR